MNKLSKALLASALCAGLILATGCGSPGGKGGGEGVVEGDPPGTETLEPVEGRSNEMTSSATEPVTD